MTLIFSVILFEIEKSAPGTNIKTIGDAIWSIISAISSVGFGDVFPVTNLGRLFIGVVMIFGVGFLSFAIVILGKFMQKIFFGGDIAEELEKIK